MKPPAPSLFALLAALSLGTCACVCGASAGVVDALVAGDILRSASAPGNSYAPDDAVFDSDVGGDVDEVDFASLQRFFSGSGNPYAPGGAVFDNDGDGDVDFADFQAFAANLNGPSRGSCASRVNPFSFTGQRVDVLNGGALVLYDHKARGTTPETGMFTLHGRPIDVLPDGKVLMDFRTRIYDPQHGRWLQRDSAGYADGGNLYEAFKTNPQSCTDPHGTDVWVTADAKEVTDTTGREWWEITYARHRNKLDVGYVFTFYQWWWGDWSNENFSETETIVEYFPRRQGINIWNRIAAEQERLVDDFTANADAKAYRDAIVVAASAPIQIATAGTAQTLVASGAAKIGVSSSTALGRIAISSTTNALVTGAGEAGGTAVLVPFGEATLADVGEAGVRGAVVGGVTGGLGRTVFEASPTLQRLIPDPMLAASRASRIGNPNNVSGVQVNKAMGDAVSDAIAIREAGIREAYFTTVGGARKVDVLVLGNDITAIESKVGRTALDARVRQELARDWWLRRQGQVGRVIWEFTPNPAGEVGPTQPLRLKLEKLGFDVRVNNP